MAELTRRYIVMQMAAEGPFDIRDVDAPFVLKPWKDPAALRALEAYRDHCYEELARELDQWIAAIATGPRLRGDVGARNEQAASRPTPAIRRMAKRKPKPGAGKRKKKKAKRRS